MSNPVSRYLKAPLFPIRLHLFHLRSAILVLGLILCSTTAVAQENPLKQSEEQARQVAQLFIDSPKFNLYVHCEAGISRSAGVGLAFARFIGNRKLEEAVLHYYVPNMLVVRKIAQQLERIL